MASTAISLQLRANKITSIRNPTFIHLFSSSPSDPNAPDQNTPNPPSSDPQSQPQSSFSSYFSDVKSSLKQQSPQQHFRHTPKPLHEKPTSKVASLEEIRKNLSEFRRRSTAPAPPSSQHISFQELYKRNVISKPQDEAAKGGSHSFEVIRESLRQLRSKDQNEGGQKSNETMSLSKFIESFKLHPVDQNQRREVIGGGDNLPDSVFGREMRDKKMGSKNDAAIKTEFVKAHSYEELGEKLRKLRPQPKGDAWFSLGELNDRLMKLREFEEKETESKVGGVSFKDLRESLLTLRMSDEAKSKKSVIQKLDVLTQLGGTPNFMLAPPKDNLVEKYFHPDNMSSAEKMKLELQKVRDEFKMSESDCGSARVQVAQLTTKIKHLATALHKKDKHSRKGLQAMVQKRKKLLKYMRRTDWDSYSLVLSKLGLRDNPDYKS